MLSIKLNSRGKKYPINKLAIINTNAMTRYFQFHRVKFLTVIILGGRASAPAVAVGGFIVTFLLLPINISPPIYFPPKGIVDQPSLLLKG